MDFSTFQTLVLKRHGLRLIVASQVRRFIDNNYQNLDSHKSKPRYFFEDVEKQTKCKKRTQNRSYGKTASNEDATTDTYQTILKDWGRKDRRKRGDFNFAVATFFYFYKTVAEISYFKEIAKVVFDEKSELYGQLVRQKETDRRRVLEVATDKPINPLNFELGTPSVKPNTPTSKKFTDCEPLREMARHITGVNASNRLCSDTGNFFERYPSPPTWFDTAQMRKSELDSVIWSATNTLCHAVNDPHMLSFREIKSLTRFLLEYTGDIPDGQAPFVSDLLKTIRHDLVPSKLLDDYSEFSFGRAEKRTRNFRKLRMIHGNKVPPKYQGDLDLLYNQHFDALESFANSDGHINEFSDKPLFEKAMALTSVIHALVIDPTNLDDENHPYIQDWVYQLRGILDEEPKAITHSVFAELQIAQLKNDDTLLKEKLGYLIEKFIEFELTNTPLMLALELNIASLDDGFHSSLAAVTFFRKSLEEQCRFIVRCNIGIIPKFRAEFVKHHTNKNRHGYPMLLSRYGGILK